MKKFLMLAIIFAGLITAAYKFLPQAEQQQLSAQLKKWLPSAAENTAPQKYILDIPDEPSAQRAQRSVLAAGESELALAYKQRAQDIQVQGEGEVIKILADDNQGSKHQRFIVRAPEGFTVLVAHNIDLAPRVEKLAVGDKISFFGEYVWNEKGGVMHWTHSDPRGRHIAGWLKHSGVTYQ